MDGALNSYSTHASTLSLVLHYSVIFLTMPQSFFICRGVTVSQPFFYSALFIFAILRQSFLDFVIHF
jgi:hypothetical protein